MEKARCIASLLADSAALAQAARLGLDARVPSCPDWDVAQLLEHTGRVHRSVTRRVQNRETERRSAADIALPAREDLPDWFEAGAEALAGVLEAAEAATPVWNWSLTPNLASFWWRRMAQETAVHRWDGQAAHGSQQAISPDVAADGVDEFLDVFLPTDLVENPEADLGGTVSLVCTDRPERWLVTVRQGVLTVRRDQPAAHEDTPLVTVSASASDLLLVLWRRVAPEAPGIDVSGDATLLARLGSLYALD
jgi:uncharacterized protein (TIGR03083 family)